MSEIKSNGNSKSQTLHEEESQNPSGAEVSLDNADTVIEGAPRFAPFETWDTTDPNSRSLVRSQQTLHIVGPHPRHPSVSHLGDLTHRVLVGRCHIQAQR